MQSLCESISPLRLEILAASGDDDAGGALIWDCGSGSRIQTLSVTNTSAPVIDVCAFNNGTNLALLTEHQVDIFKLSSMYIADWHSIYAYPPNHLFWWSKYLSFLVLSNFCLGPRINISRLDPQNIIWTTAGNSGREKSRLIK